MLGKGCGELGIEGGRGRTLYQVANPANCLFQEGSPGVALSQLDKLIQNGQSWSPVSSHRTANELFDSHCSHGKASDGSLRDKLSLLVFYSCEDTMTKTTFVKENI